MKALIFIRYVIREFPLLVIGCSLILIVTSLVETITLLFIAPIVDILASSGLESASAISHRIDAAITYLGLPVTLGVLFTFYIVLNVIKSGFQVFSTYLVLKIKYALTRDLTMSSFYEFFQSGWAFFRTSQQGKLINTFIREINIVGDAFAGVARFSAAALQLAVFVSVPFYISWEVMSISMSVAFLLATPLLLLGKISHRLGVQNTSTSNDLSISIQESLSLAKVILGFANQQKNSKILEHNYDCHVNATLKSQTFASAITNSYSSIGLLAIIATLFAARWFALPLAETSILVVSFLRIIPVISQITNQKHLMDNSFPSYEQVMKLRGQAKEFKQPYGSKIFKGFDKAIKTEKLSFSYDGRRTLLNNINVTIPKGRMIAFVGESGAGKTTLIDAIIGFNDPISGQILIDEIPLQNFNIDSYRKKIGYVPQESVLFNMSIMDNLLWATDDANDVDVKKVCKLANADEFIEKFSEGYHTVVGDRGIRLSGGQLQRIALARAMIRKPDLLILDEATSSLDTHSEKLIQQSIENIAHETTVLVIAHRLSTIKKADCIYVLEKGRIVESGTYRELSLKDGRFNSMVELQKLIAIS